jgi:hypothetical protein
VARSRLAVRWMAPLCPVALAARRAMSQRFCNVLDVAAYAEELRVILPNRVMAWALPRSIVWAIKMFDQDEEAMTPHFFGCRRSRKRSKASP